MIFHHPLTEIVAFIKNYMGIVLWYLYQMSNANSMLLDVYILVILSVFARALASS